MLARSPLPVSRSRIRRPRTNRTSNSSRLWLPGRTRSAGDRARVATSARRSAAASGGTPLQGLPGQGVRGRLPALQTPLHVHWLRALIEEVPGVPGIHWALPSHLPVLIGGTYSYLLAKFTFGQSMAQFSTIVENIELFVTWPRKITIESSFHFVRIW